MQHKNIVIIGAGNMAWHLGHQFVKAGHKVVEVYNRSKIAGEALAEELDAAFASKPEDITRTADIYIVAVSDHGIDDIILTLQLDKQIVAHTSGAVPMTGMERISLNHGIFYPLQTLTKGTHVDFKEVPIFIEGSSTRVEEELTALAKSISKSVHKLDSHKRRALHVAAVFANNFTNYLYHISSEILQKEHIDFKLLYPLMEETMAKLKTHTPMEVQTGPAKRGDYRTIGEHMNYLQGHDAYKEIYLVLSEGIMSLYKEPAEDAMGEEHWGRDFEFDENVDDYDGLPLDADDNL